MTPQQLARLSWVATLGRDAARIRLGVLCQRRAAIDMALVVLRRRAVEHRRVLSAVDLLVDAAWRRSMLERVASLEFEARRLEADIADAQRALIHQEGRVSALGEVAADLRAKATRRIDRRTENDRPARSGAARNWQTLVSQGLPKTGWCRIAGH